MFIFLGRKVGIWEDFYRLGWAKGRGFGGQECPAACLGEAAMTRILVVVCICVCLYIYIYIYISG